MADDFLASRLTSGRITAGSSVGGLLEAAGDNDWFAITLVAGANYRFTLGAAAMDAFLSLYDANGALVTFNDNGPSCLNSQFGFTATTGGTYYLGARANGSGTGAYTLAALAIDDYATGVNTTGRLTVGGAVTGAVETTGDNDWFAVTLVAGRSYTFNLYGSSPFSRYGATLGDAHLGLFASNGTLLAHNDDANGLRDSQITYKATASGTYYLQARAYDAGTGSYVLSATDTTTIAPRSAVDDYAANKTTTGRVAVGGSIGGVIEAANDLDLFAVTLEAGKSYQFSLNGAGLADPLLHLYDDIGGIIAFNDNGPTGLNSQILYTPFRSGVHHLGASAFGIGTGAYTLSAALADDYAASTATTGSVTVGGQVGGNIEVAGDNDWFAISLVAGLSYRFQLNGIAAGGTSLAAPFLGLYNSNGTLITSIDNGPSGLNSVIEFTATANGIHYLGARASGTGAYTLMAHYDDRVASTATAGRVAVGGQVGGSIESSGDRDWFAVSLIQGLRYTFSLNGVSLGDPHLALHNDAGGLLAHNDDANGSRNSQIVYTAGATGIHYLQASAYDAGTGAYTLIAATPDDTGASVNTTGRIAVGATTSGVIETLGDHDWYKITLVAGTSYRFSVNGNGLQNAVVHLYDSAGVFIATEPGGVATSTINHTATANGTYHVSVRSTGTSEAVATGRYTLSTAIDDYAGGTATTGSVRTGGAVSASIQGVGDNDWFAVSLIAGVRYTFDLIGAALNGAALGDPHLALFTAGGGLLAHNDDANGSRNSQIVYTANASGIHYLQARSYNEGSGSYNLSAVATDDYGASTTNAGLLASGNSLSGVIETGGDTDWFKVDLAQGATYRFTLSGLGNSLLADPFLKLYNPAGTAIIASNDDGLGGKNSLITWTATASGTYHLEASAKDGGTGVYVIASALVDDHLASTATSGKVAVEGSTTGHIEIAGDKDWFAVSLVAGESYRFTLNGTGLPDPFLDLYNSAGALIASNNNSGQDGLNALINHTATASGTYYLSARAYDAGTGAYSLAAARTDDYASTAPTNGRVLVGGSTTGSIETYGDMDLFAVTLVSGTSYRFTVSGTGGGAGLADPYLNFYTPLGASVANDNSPVGGMNSLINYRATSSGTYHLGVRAGGSGSGTGSYAIAVAIDDHADGVPTTSNVSVGGSINGTIESAGDVDVFAVSLIHGVRYTFSLNSNTLANAQLALLSSTGGFITSQDVNASPTHAQMVQTVATSGTYHLAASAAGGGVGAYALLVSASDDFSNTPLTSGYLNANGAINGVIETAGDSDWIRVNLVRGASYRFTLSGMGLEDPFLTLYDPVGKALASDDNGLGGKNALIDYTAGTSNPYYLGVRANGTGTGWYSVNVALTDDHAASSITSGLLSMGGSTTGNIEKAGDSDWFAVTLAKGASYRFTLNGPGMGSTSLALYNSAGALVPTIGDGPAGGTSREIHHQATADGTYYLSASATGTGTGAYTLSAAYDDRAGHKGTTGSVVVNGSATGVIETAGDNDWFAVTLVAGVTYGFTLVRAQVPNGPMINPYLSLYTGTGALIASNDDANGSINSLINHTATTSGTHYLGVRDQGSSTGPYAVAAVVLDDFSVGVATNGRATLGGLVSGNIEKAGDTDWFAVTLVAGTSYRFALNGTGLADPTLDLNNSDGWLVASNDNNLTGRNSVINHTATRSGTYYLAAGANGTGTGSYVLVAGIDDFADTVAPSTGRVLVGGATATGNLETTGDLDLFAVSLISGVQYTFRLNGTSLGNPFLSLHGNSGVLLASNDDLSASVRNSQIVYRATASGTYYLGASASANAYEAGTGSYVLSASAADDHAASTATNGSAAVGAPATGIIESTGDSDWFKITLVAGMNYRFLLSGTSLTDPLLRLYNSAGTLIATHADAPAGSQHVEINYKATANATFYLGASAKGTSTGTYSLTATYDDYDASVATTGRVSVGASTAGAIETPGDNDWFAVTLVAGVTYGFTLVRVQGANGSMINPYLSLYTGTGALIAANDDANGSINSQITYTATTSGTHYLGARDQGSSTGPYSVAAVVLDDFSVGVNTNGRVAVGGSTGGNIDSAFDADGFAVTLVAGTGYRFTLNGVGLADPYLHLYNGAYAELAFNDNGISGRNSVINYKATQSGTYYLAARAAGNGTGTYVLAAAIDDYADNVPGPSYLSSDTLPTGSITVGGSPVNGNIESQGDLDLFAVSLVGGVQYVFKLDGAPLANPYLSLYDSVGTRVAFNDDVSAASRNSQIVHTVAASGTYYLGASANGTGTGKYTLTAAAVDDYAQNTATTGSVAVGGSTTGRIESPLDQDWFRVTLAANTSYRFALNGAGLEDPYLTLYNSAGAPVAFNDNGFQGPNPVINHTTTSGGTFYLGARASGIGLGAYALAASIDDQADNLSTSGRLTVEGAPTSGNIESAGDLDMFAVTLEAGKGYRFMLDGSGLADPFLHLYDASGGALASNNDVENGRNSEIQYTATRAGTYYLGARSFDAGTGRYTLAAIVDDRPASARTDGLVVVGGPSTQGTIERSGDSDWFAVVLMGGVTYTFSMNRVPGLNGAATVNPHLSLYNFFSGQVLAFNDDANGSTNAAFQYTAASTGSYYLIARDSASGSGAYTVAAAVADDFGAGISTRGSIEAGRSVSGNIETGGDNDWFAVQLVGGALYQFTLDGSGLADPYLSFYNGAGALIASNDNGPAGLNSLLKATAPADGLYYLGVRDKGTGTGSYTLAARVIDDCTSDTSTTGRVQVDGSTTGVFEVLGDNDWFAVTLSAGTTYRFHLEGLQQPYLSLYDSNGRGLALNNGYDSDKSQVLYTPSTSGTYFLRAENQGPYTGRYTVHAEEVQTLTGGSGNFSIQIHYTGDQKYAHFFSEAAARWSEILIRDLPDVVNSEFGFIDDLLIEATIEDLYSPFGTPLAQAGITHFREGGGLPYRGVLEIHSGTIEELVTRGLLGATIEHEIGHVLGMDGALWSRLGLLAGDSNFIGANAVNAYRTLLRDATVTSVPLEPNPFGGPSSHWSEAVFHKELMTPYAEEHLPMPISTITIGALADLGYGVNYAAAAVFAV